MHRGEEAGDVCRTSRGWINSGMCLMNFRKSSNNDFLLKEEKNQKKKPTQELPPKSGASPLKAPLMSKL